MIKRQGGRLEAREYVDGVLRGDRVILARAITLIESELPSDADLAAEVLDRILPHSGNSRRLGITGSPGVGKSTFIDALGMHLIREHNEKIAVLSVDPSSPLTGGSILGDKTRMERLSVEENAYIRPSPSRGHGGGVARRTRETMLLCEAAGFGNILVETVGVGQSETAVRSMTDFFLVLILPGSGDELQGIKRGVLEMIDGVAINKVDGDNERSGQLTRAQYASALHLFRRGQDEWTPSVLTVSSTTGKGISDLWSAVLEHHAHAQASGSLVRRRRSQALNWMHELIAAGLNDLLRSDQSTQVRLAELEKAVERGDLTPASAAHNILSTFRRPEH